MPARAAPNLKWFFSPHGKGSFSSAQLLRLPPFRTCPIPLSTRPYPRPDSFPSTRFPAKLPGLSNAPLGQARYSPAKPFACRVILAARPVPPFKSFSMKQCALTSHTVQPSFTGLHPHSVPAPGTVRLLYPTHRLSFLTARQLMLPCRAVHHTRTATQPRVCHCIRLTAAFLRAAPYSHWFPVKISGLSMRECRQSKTATRKQLFAHLLHGLHIPQHAAAGCISCAHTHSSALPSHTHWPTLCISIPTLHPKE
jgi:hypothetical protein